MTPLGVKIVGIDPLKDREHHSGSSISSAYGRCRCGTAIYRE
jgi:hypothetical protein